jgi:hypothetical protein
VKVSRKASKTRKPKRRREVSKINFKLLAAVIDVLEKGALWISLNLRLIR